MMSEARDNYQNQHILPLIKVSHLWHKAEPVVAAGSKGLSKNLIDFF